MNDRVHERELAGARLLAAGRLWPLARR